MGKSGSIYTVQFNCVPEYVNSVVQNYLMANGYILTEKKGEQFYRAGDAIVGYRGLKYNISGNTLTIEAWLVGLTGKINLDKNKMNIGCKQYKNSIATIIKEVENPINSQQDISNQNSNFNQSQNNVSQLFQEDVNKRNEKMCEAGFWLSIIGVILSFFGFSYGVAIYIADFYFASKGLKTRKREKAIVTIVLSIISIIITIINIILSMLIKQ